MVVFEQRNGEIRCVTKDDNGGCDYHINIETGCTKVQNMSGDYGFIMPGFPEKRPLCFGEKGYGC